MNDSSNQIVMYTDGASRGNPGPGGYGVILFWKGVRKELSAGYRRTTNNRMEIMAVIAGLEAMKKTDMDILVYSDSQYVVKAIEEGWLRNWLHTNFKGGKKNKDLWLRYNELAQHQRVRMKWVKGHNNNPYNERCDQLATSAADGHSLLIDEVFEMESGQ